eukprot:jgi/Chrpa1/4959/Chrysochromulina_OHIO_Genome00002464-RA
MAPTKSRSLAAGSVPRSRATCANRPPRPSFRHTLNHESNPLYDVLSTSDGAEGALPTPSPAPMSRPDTMSVGSVSLPSSGV